MLEPPKLSLSTFQPSHTFPPYLNTPRSLEACRLHGINPIELVSVPLSEFQKDFPNDPDIAKQRFKKYEQIRQELYEKVCKTWQGLVKKNWQPESTEFTINSINDENYEVIYDEYNNIVTKQLKFGNDSNGKTSPLKRTRDKIDTQPAVSLVSIPKSAHCTLLNQQANHYYEIEENLYKDLLKGIRIEMIKALESNTNNTNISEKYNMMNEKQRQKNEELMNKKLEIIKNSIERERQREKEKEDEINLNKKLYYEEIIKEKEMSKINQKNNNQFEKELLSKKEKEAMEKARKKEMFDANLEYDISTKQHLLNNKLKNEEDYLKQLRKQREDNIKYNREMKLNKLNMIKSNKEMLNNNKNNLILDKLNEYEKRIEQKKLEDQQELAIKKEKNEELMSKIQQKKEKLEQDLLKTQQNIMNQYQNKEEKIKNNLLLRNNMIKKRKMLKDIKEENHNIILKRLNKSNEYKRLNILNNIKKKDLKYYAIKNGQNYLINIKKKLNNIIENTKNEIRNQLSSSINLATTTSSSSSPSVTGSGSPPPKDFSSVLDDIIEKTTANLYFNLKNEHFNFTIEDETLDTDNKEEMNEISNLISSERHEENKNTATLDKNNTTVITNTLFNSTIPLPSTITAAPSASATASAPSDFNDKILVNNLPLQILNPIKLKNDLLQDKKIIEEKIKEKMVQTKNKNTMRASSKFQEAKKYDEYFNSTSNSPRPITAPSSNISLSSSLPLPLSSYNDKDKKKEKKKEKDDDINFPVFPFAPHLAVNDEEKNSEENKEGDKIDDNEQNENLRQSNDQNNRDTKKNTLKKSSTLALFPSSPYHQKFTNDNRPSTSSSIVSKKSTFLPLSKDKFRREYSSDHPLAGGNGRYKRERKNGQTAQGLGDFTVEKSKMVIGLSEPVDKKKKEEEKPENNLEKKFEMISKVNELTEEGLTGVLDNQIITQEQQQLILNVSTPSSPRVSNSSPTSPSLPPLTSSPNKKKYPKIAQYKENFDSQLIEPAAESFTASPSPSPPTLNTIKPKTFKDLQAELQNELQVVINQEREAEEERMLAHKQLTNSSSNLDEIKKLEAIFNEERIRASERIIVATRSYEEKLRKLTLQAMHLKIDI